MPRRIDCTVIVLSFNSEKVLPALLQSLLAQTVEPAQCLLLDNGSRDGSVKILEDWAASREFVSCHLFDENLGFARAMNRGMALAKSGKICLLNSDLVLDPSYLEVCCSILDGSPQVGMAAGVIYRLTGGKKTRVIDSLGITISLNRHFHDIATEKMQYAPMREDREPFGIGGCAPVYSRKMLDAVAKDEPPFLEMLESYYEDVDLAWRSRLSGWRAVCTPKTRAWHVREGSLSSRPLKKTARNRCHRNRYWVMLLNENPSIWIRHFPFWFFYEILMLFKILLKPGLIVPFFQALRGIPEVWRLRKKREAGRSHIPLQAEQDFFTRGEGAYIRNLLNRYLGS